MPKVAMAPPVAVSIALRSYALEEATIPVGRIGLISSTDTAAPTENVPGAKLTLA